MLFSQFLIYFFRSLLLPHSPKTMEWAMLRLLNKDRRKHRLPPLFMQEDLRDVARRHSQDMARKDYFSHTNLEGKSPGDRLKGARITEAISGENLAKIGGFSFPTHRAEEGLMNSPGHRANILNSHYNCVGVGVIKSMKGVYYYTQNFAKRELIFSKKIPQRISLRRGLLLKGKSIRDLRFLIVQIALSGEPVRTLSLSIRRRAFYNRISFKNPGKYTITFSVPNGKNYRVVNHFDVSVKRGWIL